MIATPFRACMRLSAAIEKTSAGLAPFTAACNTTGNLPAVQNEDTRASRERELLDDIPKLIEAQRQICLTDAGPADRRGLSSTLERRLLLGRSDPAPARIRRLVSTQGLRTAPASPSRMRIACEGSTPASSCMTSRRALAVQLSAYLQWHVARRAEIVPNRDNVGRGAAGLLGRRPKATQCKVMPACPELHGCRPLSLTCDAV